ncbi:MAG: hypothetical protein AMJ54_07600 [Deltaproteobacteria bacterium SG8_13]|nr:MAG: hypothetical protein AMJ54_07600 [Deltaproteobacteria bacterium SG8_13]
MKPACFSHYCVSASSVLPRIELPFAAEAPHPGICTQHSEIMMKLKSVGIRHDLPAKPFDPPGMDGTSIAISKAA